MQINFFETEMEDDWNSPIMNQTDRKWIYVHKFTIVLSFTALMKATL